MNVSNHITKIKAENTPKFDLYNVKMDDCGIPNYKGVTISSYSLYTLILKCYPHWKVLQIIYSDGTSKALILSKLLTLTAFIKVILTTMRLFNLQIGQNKINDSQYTPKSKRKWYHGMIVYLNYKMEALITKYDKLRNTWTDPKYVKNLCGSRAQITIERAKRKEKWLYTFSSMI